MVANLKESETRRELIIPALRASGWADEQIVDEYQITHGRIVPMGSRHKSEAPKRADYVLLVVSAIG